MIRRLLQRLRDGQATDREIESLDRRLFLQGATVTAAGLVIATPTIVVPTEPRLVTYALGDVICIRTPAAHGTREALSGSYFELNEPEGVFYQWSMVEDDRAPPDRRVDVAVEIDETASAEHIARELSRAINEALA